MGLFLVSYPQSYGIMMNSLVVVASVLYLISKVCFGNLSRPLIFAARHARHAKIYSLRPIISCMLHSCSYTKRNRSHFLQPISVVCQSVLVGGVVRYSMLLRCQIRSGPIFPQGNLLIRG